MQCSVDSTVDDAEEIRRRSHGLRVGELGSNGAAGSRLPPETMATMRLARGSSVAWKSAAARVTAPEGSATMSVAARMKRRRGADFGFGDRDDAVDEAQDVGEVELAEGLGAEAVGEGAGGLGGGPLDEGAGAEGLCGVGGEFGFAAADLDSCEPTLATMDCREGGDRLWRGAGFELDRGGYAGEQAAAGDGREDQVIAAGLGIDLGRVCSQDFEAAGGLAGDDGGVVVGRDHGVAVLRARVLRLSACARCWPGRR